MTQPGGYCDKNGDGKYSDDPADTDWVKGYEEFKVQCNPTCGDGKCANPSETHQNCPADCPPVCGDGKCEGGETCGSCANDCGPCGPTCGDGKCEGGETCGSCANDCGPCGPTCGDGKCEGGETCGSCANDCGPCGPTCGDGKCEGGEQCLSCPADCSKGNKVACSKLSAQDLGYTAEFDAFLKSCPRIAKFIGGAGGPGKGFAPFNEMAAYKCACGGTTVLRVYGPAKSFATGQDLWKERYAFLEQANPWQKAAIDYLESDNECDAGHCWFMGEGACPYCPSPQKMEDYANFLSQWIDAAAAHGFRPLIGNFSVGAPGGNIDDCGGDGNVTFSKMIPVLHKAAAKGGGWAYHGYTDTWEKSASSGASVYKTFRYRKFVTCFPQIKDIPLILTESGFDKGGNPDNDGFVANGGWAPYLDWLAWYQTELNKDPYVKGSTLFTFGPAGNWSSFRLNPHLADLQQLIGPASCTP